MSNYVSLKITSRRRMVKIVAIKCQILRLKCTKNRFRLGSRPRPRWGSLQRSPRPPAAFKGPTSKGREGMRREEGRVRREEEE